MNAAPNLRLAAAIPVLILLGWTGQPIGALATEAASGRLSAHHVHLLGSRGDNEVNKRDLLARYEACIVKGRLLGLAVEPLPAGGIPSIVSSEELDIYYARNRTLTITQGSLHSIGYHCELTHLRHHMWLLRSGIGQCDVNLIERVGRNVCDGALHRAAAPRRPGPAASKGLSPSAEANQRIIAATPCTVQVVATSEAGPLELCVADLRPAPARPIDPFPIPPAWLNSGLPGLLLSIRGPLMSVDADAVELNIQVDESMFDIPAGVTLRSVPANLLRVQ